MLIDGKPNPYYRGIGNETYPPESKLSKISCLKLKGEKIMEGNKTVGQVINTLIHIKDTMYGQLSLEEKNALDDACNLLYSQIGGSVYFDDCTYDLIQIDK